MNRSEQIAKLDDPEFWDLLIIGGGASGLGTAVDSASRGYRTLLLEQGDFAQGTSSRSTKLVHGGVRYLQQGNVSLVTEALHERGLLFHNAPHLVHNQPFVVPNYDWWEGPFYGIGLKVYDLLAGNLGLGPSRHLNVEETLIEIPTLEPEGLRGGTIYYDGQFDDARLAINLAQTAINEGATAISHTRVLALQKNGGLITGVEAVDEISGRKYELNARVVVNATGAFTDAVLKMDDSEQRPVIRPSQGVHIVLDSSFMPGESAIMVPKTDDGRILFAVPWYDRVLVGTTDVAIPDAVLEPQATEDEVEFLLTHIARYLTRDPGRHDILSIFAGIRPLVETSDEKGTSALSRDHVVMVSASGLVTVAGGKWTTYRKMAQDTVDQAMIVAGLEAKPCVTENLRLHGWLVDAEEKYEDLERYGSEAPAVMECCQTVPDGSDLLHPDLPYIVGEVVWAVREEMALTIEDVLSRRLRALILNARASISIAPRVSRIIAAERNLGQKWIDQQIVDFQGLAGRYLPPAL
jgi:glycerol-3-phosphate dehydrogenase